MLNHSKNINIFPLVYDFLLLFNHNFTGKSPDCGVDEVEQELPHYGPRPLIMEK